MVNGLYLNDYLNNLNQQISSSVDKIKQKSARPAPLDDSTKDEKPTAQYGYHSLHSYAYQLLETDVSYNLTAYKSAEPPQMQDSAYAAGSYHQVAEIDKQPSVLLDFMFTNNREFDFKV